MSTNTTARAAELELFGDWISSHGRIPRMSSLDPVELSLARWLDARHSEDRSGALDADTARCLNSIPGAMPAGHRRSVTEWCTLVEGFLLDRGHLPSGAATDDYEMSLGRAVDKIIIPALRSGPVSAFSPLRSSLRELQDRAAGPRRSVPARKRHVSRPAAAGGSVLPPSSHPLKDGPVSGAAGTGSSPVESGAFRHWVGEHGRIPRLSSLDPAELALARWLEDRRPEALAGTLDTETDRVLRSIHGAVPARSTRSIGQWCILVEGFVLDRGTLPSAASPDDFESSLARAVDDVIIPVVRMGGILLEHTALDAALPELVKHAVRLREAPTFVRRPSPVKPAPVRPRKPSSTTSTVVARGAAEDRENRRLAELRAYVAGNGFLPPSGHVLSKWAARRIQDGDGPVSGAAEEAAGIRAKFPAYPQGSHLRWAREAADHIRAHGTLPQPAGNTVQARQLERLRQAVEDQCTPPGLLAGIRMVLAAPPAPGAGEKARLAETQRLKDLRDYVQEHGHLPPRRSSLGGWFVRRIEKGVSPVPGTVDELKRIADGHPTYTDAKAVVWAQAAAARHARQGSFAGGDWIELRRKQDSLRQLVDRYDMPGHLLPAIELVLAQPGFAREQLYRAKWSAVFSDFTVWFDEHGALPNRRSADREEYRLANWLNVQRANQRAGTLRPDLAVRLGAVEGALTSRFRHRPPREEWIAQVMAFYAAAGRLPRRGARDDAERKLGKWLENKRRDIQAGKSAAADLGELAGLPGALTPRPAGPTPRTNSESAARVADFHAAHGHLPRRTSDDPEERRLSRWLRNMRLAVRSGKTAAFDLSALVAIPGALPTSSAPRRAG